MSEEKETVPENPEHDEQIEEQEELHEEHQPPKQRSGGSGAFIAILLSLGALGGGYYLWQQQQIASADTRDLKAQVENLNNVIAQNRQELLARMQSVPQHQHPQIDKRLAEMESALFELRSRLGQERRGWQVAEVEYLLRIAEHRLRLERDVDTAIAALQNAKQRLQSLDSEAFAPVITRIGTDINQLAAVKMPDRDAMAAKVANVAVSIDTLPLATTAVHTPSPKQETPTADAGKGSLWQRMWHDIRSLVTIRRQGEVSRPLLVPEERYFLRQNLKLKLESARLALMAGNDASWKASLGEAVSWLQQYYDGSDSGVADAISSLKQLSVIELNPPLPTLSDTRQMLQQASMQISVPAQTPAPKPAPAPASPEKAKAPAEQKTPTPAETAPEADTAATDKGSDDAAAATPDSGDVPQLPQGTGQ